MAAESSMLELLSVTDAAVKALNKSTRSNSLASSKSSHSSRGSASQRQERDKSGSPASTSSRQSVSSRQGRDKIGTPDSGICKTYTATESKSHNVKDFVHDNSIDQPGVIPLDRSSDESTTASDVLIRSTLADPAEVSFHDGGQNVSSFSKCSKSSFGADNFNSSGPQKVKISTKRLREIKSPFETDTSPRQTEEAVPPALTKSDKNDKNTSSGAKKFSPEATNRNYVKNDIAKTKVPVPRDLIQTLPMESEDEEKESNGDKIAKITNSDVHRSRQKNFSEMKRSPRFPGDKIDRPGVKRISNPLKSKTEFQKEKIHHLDSSPRSDSNDRKRSPRFPGERVDKVETTSTCNSSKSKIESDVKAVDNEKESEISPPLINKVENLGGSIEIVDIVPGKEIDEVNISGSSGSLSQPEIITVPERIVTISARNSVSSSDVSVTDSAAMEDDKIPPKLPARFQLFSKVNGVNLQQGAPVEGIDEPDKQKQSKDIEISKYSLSDKEKLVKQTFFKRYEQAGPVRRVVQPKFVGKRDNTEKTSQNTAAGQSSDVLTAAIAASAAVAATQPFLKAQHDLETKMTEILQKIADVKKTDGLETTTDASNQRVIELEKQVSALTEQRIEHLEKLQEQHLQMQAKLLSLTRTSPEVRSRSPVSYSRRSVSPVRNDGPKKAFSKTRIQDSTDYRDRKSQYMSDTLEHHVSPFATPAPRSRAPRPVAYDTSDIDLRKGENTRGILEEILASAESPRRGIPAPIMPTRSESYDYIPEKGPKSPNVKKAEVLEQELSDIKQQMKDLVHNVEHRKSKDVLKVKQGENHGYGADDIHGPSPLDPYLKQPLPSGASPYKSIPELSPTRFNAPVLPGFSEAAQVLRQVEKNKAYLESNLEAVLRGRQETEVYTLLEHLYHDRANPEMSHIKKIVDKKIDMLRAELDREITDEVILAELRKKQLPIYPSKAGQMSTSTYMKGAGVRGQAGPKIDTGLKRGRKPTEPTTVRNVPTNKENKPTVQRKPAKKPRSTFEDEEYMTRVYGKAAYQNKRTTVKDPYLHYQNTSKMKAPRPAAALDVKGMEVKSAKTQTASGVRQFYFSPTSGSYIPVSSQATAAPIPGQLIPMAVPLGGPRMDGGLTAQVTSTTPSGPLTSTPAAPQVTAAKNVTMVTIPTEDDINEKPVPELGKQVLPAVDIDSDVSEMSEFRRRGDIHLKSPVHSPIRPQYEVTYHRDRPEDEMEAEISDEDISPESAPGLALPGYQPPSPPPAVEVVSDFPPKNVPPVMASDIIAEDIRRRDAMENRAVEWVEQELMARIIMETYPLKKDVPQEMPHVVPDESVTSEPEEDKEQAMFVMDSIGRAGLQMFVDAGRPVDNNLVNALIREVLIEKVSTVLGQRPEDESTGRPTDQGVTHKLAATASGASKYVEEKEDTSKEEPDYYRIKTPQPTPKASPISSPVRVISPPITPDMSPRQPVQYESKQVYVAEPVQPDSEPESVSLDLSEELRRLAGKMVVEQVDESVDQVHDVITPVSTPVPELPEEEERPLTPPPQTPRKEIIVQEEFIEVKKTAVTPPKVKPELEVPEVKEHISTSPQPWADPSFPLPEENPSYKDAETEMSPKHHEPYVLSVAPAEAPPPQMVQQVPTPPRKTPSPVPTESESYSEPSSVSDTMNQSVSEGQWLISKSEGEVANFPFTEDARQRMRSQHKPDISTTSTLWEASEIEDEAAEFPVSEGEFQYRPSVAPDRDPVLLMLSRLQHQPIAYGQYNMPSNHVQDMLSTNGKSMGEVSILGTAKSMGEVNPREVTGRSFGEIRVVQSKGYEKPSSARGSNDSGEFSRQKSPLRMTDLRIDEAEEDDLVPVKETKQVDRRDVDNRQSPIRAGARSPSRPITVTPGGAPTGGRKSPIKSALKKPPQATKSQGVPEKSETLKRVVNVRSSDGNINDSMETGRSMEGIATMSDQGTRTFTPDQMNLDDLIQSGYLMQNLSQSGEMGQSGGMSQTLDKNSTRDSSEFRGMSPDRLSRGKSLGLTYSYESENGDSFSEQELKRLAGGKGSGTLKMSVTIPSTALSEEDSEMLSEIDVTDGNTR